ncbi:hypothetical protein EON81_28025 [bacterium]|nr:MAG: hypothetical protein EON81_28025 [bacterium]
MKTEATGRTEEKSMQIVPAQKQPTAEPVENAGLRTRVASEIWNAAVREDVVADIKARLSRGEIDLSPEAIASVLITGA